MSSTCWVTGSRSSSAKSVACSCLGVAAVTTSSSRSSASVRARCRSQQDRRPVGPVRVVEDDQQGPLAARVPQQPGDRVELPEPRLPAPVGRGRRRGAEHVRSQHGEVGREADAPPRARRGRRGPPVRAAPGPTARTGERPRTRRRTPRPPRHRAAAPGRTAPPPAGSCRCRAHPGTARHRGRPARAASSASQSRASSVSRPMRAVRTAPLLPAGDATRKLGTPAGTLALAAVPARHQDSHIRTTVQPNVTAAVGTTSHPQFRSSPSAPAMSPPGRSASSGSSPRRT